MRIQHNIMAMNAYRNYSNNTSALSKNLEKLSSGYRINRAGDDAAGLAISEKMRAQITGLETAQKNAKDGISLVQTAEGALTEVHDMLNRMVELADQSANGTYDNEVDRANLQKELDQLRAEVDRIADSANFNGIKLLNGELGDATGITEGVGDAVGASSLTNMVSSVTAMTEGSLVPGTEERQAQNSFYMVDEFQATATAGAAASTSFSLVLGDGAGGSITLSFELDSSATNGEVTTVKMEDILNAIKGAGAGATSVGVSVGGVTAGAATVSIEGNFGGSTTATLENLLDVYDIKYENNQLTVTAKSTDDITDAGISNVKASELKASITVTSSNTADTTKMQEQLLEDLNADSTAANIALGAQSKAEVKGADAVAGKYTVASAVLDVDETALTTSGSAVKIGDMTYLMIEKGAELTDDLQKLVDSVKNGTADDKITIVEFDKTATTTGNVGNALTELAHAINSNSGATHINASVTGTGDIQLQEDEGWGMQIANSGDKSKITKLDTTTIGASGVTYGGRDGLNELSIDKTLAKGTTLTIGGKKFEFGTDESKIAAGSNYVAFTDGQAGDNAKALVDALNKAGITANLKDGSDTVIELGEGVELDDASSKGLTLQIGDTSENFNQLTVAIHATDCESLGIDKLSIADQTSAAAAVDTIKAAINQVSSIRGTLGATQNRLDHTINNLSVMTENIQDAESTIRDTDVADEMMAYTKNNILIQSAQAMLAQANQVPQGVLQLLQ